MSEPGPTDVDRKAGFELRCAILDAINEARDAVRDSEDWDSEDYVSDNMTIMCRLVERLAAIVAPERAELAQLQQQCEELTDALYDCCKAMRELPGMMYRDNFRAAYERAFDLTEPNMQAIKGNPLSTPGGNDAQLNEEALLVQVMALLRQEGFTPKEVYSVHDGDTFVGFEIESEQMDLLWYHDQSVMRGLRSGSRFVEPFGRKLSRTKVFQGSLQQENKDGE